MPDGYTQALYVMKAYKTSLPDGYVNWSVINAPDFTGQYSGYNPSELIDIAIDYQSETQVNGSAGPLIGFAGGDLGGIYPAPTVVGIQTVPVAPTMPVDGQVYTYVAAQKAWVPKFPNLSPGGLRPNTIVGTDGRSNLATAPAIDLTKILDGYVLQSQGTGLSSLIMAPINVGGGPTFIDGKLPVINGGSPIKRYEVPAVAGTASTSQTTFQVIGSFTTDISLYQTDVNHDTTLRKITLQAIVSSTGINGELQLYDFTNGAMIPLTLASPTFLIDSITPTLLSSWDLTPYLTLVGPIVYQIRLIQDNLGTALDQVICSSCKLQLDW